MLVAQRDVNIELGANLHSCTHPKCPIDGDYMYTTTMMGMMHAVMLLMIMMWFMWEFICALSDDIVGYVRNVRFTNGLVSIWG